MSSLPTPETAWNDIWRPILEEDGVLNMEGVKSLLFDYGANLHANSILYPYITDNRVTDPQHDVEEVIQISDQVMAESIDTGIQTVLDYLLNTVNAVNTESPEVQLEALLSQITSLYETPRL